MTSRAQSVAQVEPRGSTVSLRGSSAMTLALAAVVLAAGALSLEMVRSLPVSGDPLITFDSDLGAGDSRPSAAVSEGVTVSPDGYVLDAGARGAVTLSVPLATTWQGKQIIRLWAYGGPGVATRAELLDGQRAVRDLGRAERWVGRAFDVTGPARAADGRLWLRISTSNDSNAQVLFFDKLQVIRAKAASRAGVGTVAFCAWIASLALIVLLLARAPRRDLLLIVPIGVLAAITWPDVRAEAFAPLGPELGSLWGSARGADVLSLDHGLLWGSFGGDSHLAGQLLGAAVPLVGEGAAGARAATLLIAVFAVAAVWWAGGRVAGLGGSLAATAGLLVLDGFRAVALDDPQAACLVLTGALYVGALHRVLGHRDARSFGWLAAASALAVLAEPLLFGGLVLVLLFVAGLRLVPAHRRRALAIAAVVLAVLLLPNRISVAHQADGDIFGDLSARAAAARAVEFPPPRSAADGGDGMASYIFGNHSLSVVAGGTLDGAYDATAAVGQRDESGLFGLVALLAVLAGAAFTLCVPKLRWLLVAPIVVTAPLFFLIDRGTGTPFGAVAFWLPALLVSVAVLMSAVARVVRER